MKKYSFQGVVDLFPLIAGWHFVRAPREYVTLFRDEAKKNRGLVAVTATVGKISWDTSLLPLGDGTLFIALPQKVRKKEDIRVGDMITVSFVRRKRKVLP